MPGIWFYNKIRETYYIEENTRNGDIIAIYMITQKKRSLADLKPICYFASMKYKVQYIKEMVK